jgi:hypothetical protein
VREFVVEQVDKFELRVGSLRGDLVHPAGDGLSVASGVGAAEDDTDLDHKFPSMTFC